MESYLRIKCVSGRRRFLFYTQTRDLRKANFITAYKKYCRDGDAPVIIRKIEILQNSVAELRINWF